MTVSLSQALSGADEHEYITANYSTEELIIPQAYSVIGVKGDENSRRAWFKLVRIPDELDLTTGSMHVIYINALGQNGVYAVDDRTVDGNGNVIFSWLLSPNACITEGKITFALCGYSGGVEWHTQPAESLIGKFIDGAICSDVDDDDPEDVNRYMQLAEMVSSMRTDVTNAQNGVSALQTNMTSVQSGLSAAQSNISTLQSNLGTAQSNISTLQTSVGSMQSHVDALEDSNSYNTQRLDNIETAMLTHTELSAALTDGSGAILETSAGYALGAEDSLPLASTVSNLIEINNYLSSQIEELRIRVRSLENQLKEEADLVTES